MNATVQNFHVANDHEAGSAFALLLAAAGYEVEVDFVDGSAFISTDDVAADVRLLDNESPQNLVRQLQERLSDPTLADEVHLAEMSSDFRKPAA